MANLREIRKKSQSAMELIILVGIIIAIVVSIAFYLSRPKGDIILAKAEEIAATIAAETNKLAELSPGSKRRIKIEIPKGIESVDYDLNEVLIKVASNGQLSDFHRRLNIGLAGYNFGPMDGGEGIAPGMYDIVLEYMDGGVCIYPVGNDKSGKSNREKYCRCFFDVLDKPEITNLVCKHDGSNVCTDLVYGSNISSLQARCINQNNDPTKGFIRFSLINWKNETVFEDRMFKPDADGNFILNFVNFKVENSGEFIVKATCYESCYAVRNNETSLINTSSEISQIPYGTIVPFLLDEFGGKIYLGNQSHYYLIDPDNADNLYMKSGKVKPEDNFIIRTGYECRGGECINVNASLYHRGYP